MTTTTPTRRPRPGRRRLVGAAAALLALAAVPAAVAGPAAAAEPATLTVSDTSLPASGGTVTVTGTGFDPAAHVGTRPPFAGQPSGVYVVFGRFGEPWRPSQGAPSGSRQVIRQVWALPQAQHDVLDPTGANPEIVLLSPDGDFTATLELAPAAGTGVYGIATYAGSGAVNPVQETFTAVDFDESPTTTSTTTAPTTTTTSTTTSTAPPTVPPTVPPAGEAASANGPGGQTLTVQPATGLDPAGAEVLVTGSGYDTALGVYLALCVDQGPGAAPSPCLGGATTEGAAGSSLWISSNPPPYAAGLTTPWGAGGTFSTALTIAAADEHVDCLAEGVRCVIATRADHTNAADRSGDVKVPVRFAGQDPVDEPEAPAVPTATVSPTTVAAGGTVTVTATGMVGGEQVQVRLAATGAVLATTTATGEGAVRVDVVIPPGTAAGTHRLEVRGITSGRTVTTGDVSVTEAAAAVAGTVAASAGDAAAATGSRTTAATGTLARTGGSVAPAWLGLALLSAGIAVLAVRARGLAVATTREATR